MYLKLFSKCSVGARGVQELSVKLSALDRSQGGIWPGILSLISVSQSTSWSLMGKIWPRLFFLYSKFSTKIIRILGTLFCNADRLCLLPYGMCIDLATLFMAVIYFPLFVSILISDFFLSHFQCLQCAFVQEDVSPQHFGIGPSWQLHFCVLLYFQIFAMVPPLFAEVAQPPMQ